MSECTIYLFDYENVGMNGFNAMTLSPDDRVIVFYSDRNPNISMNLVNELIEKDIEFEFLKVNTGTSNALDFQLSSYLGYLVKENNYTYWETKIFIVSNDKGYDCLCRFWKNNSEGRVEIKRIGTQKVPDADVKSALESVKASPNSVAEILSAAARSQAKEKLADTAAKKSKKNKKKLVKTELSEIDKLLCVSKTQTEQVLVALNGCKRAKTVRQNVRKIFKNQKEAEAIIKKLEPLMEKKNKY